MLKSSLRCLKANLSWSIIWSPWSGRRIIVPRRVRLGLRVARHIAVRVHPLLVPLYPIGQEKDPGHRIVIARVVIIQPRHVIVELAGVAFVGAQGAHGVAPGAIGAVELLALD